MTIKFCASAGCHEVAIGGNLATSNEHCRPHWREIVLPECVDVDVVGEYMIASVDGTDVAKGGVAKLHPGETNIAALVYAGAVKVRPQPEAQPEAKPKGEKA